MTPTEETAALVAEAREAADRWIDGDPSPQKYLASVLVRCARELERQSRELAEARKSD